MSDAVEKLIDYWRGQGLSLSPGCDPKFVAEFEGRHHVELPRAVRAYYVAADGMKETPNDSEDINGFSFWPLARVSRVHEVTDGALIPPFNNDVAFFIFADYMQWSWAYAVSCAPRSIGSVILVGRHPPERVATSFEEFVDLYISNSDRLYKSPPFEG